MELQKLSGDPSLTIVGIERGSIILVLEGSQEGLEKIEKMVKSAQLTNILGLNVSNIWRVALQEQTTQEKVGMTVYSYLDAQCQIEAILKEKLNISQEERLFGVTEKLEELKEHLKNQKGSWFISVTGDGGIGKTSIVEKLVRENAILSGFEKLAWITAKRSYFNTKTGETEDTANILNIPSMIFEIANQLNIRLPASTNDQFLYLQGKLRSASYLIIIDNLETLEEYETLILRFKTSHLPNDFRPSKVIFTSRIELQRQDINVTELRLKGLSKEASLQLIKHQGNSIDLIQNASDDELLPIYVKTEGNPLLIKLVVNMIGRDDSPLNEIIDIISSKQSLFKYLYGENLYLISDNARRKVMYSMTQFSPSSAVSREMLKIASGLEDNELEKTIQECLQYSLLSRLPRKLNQESSYSIHNLLYEYLTSESDLEVRQREIQQDCRQRTNPADILMYWLYKTESEADIDHILTALNNNKNNLKKVSVCVKVIIKFTNKAININKSEDWLIKAIEPILQKIDNYRLISDVPIGEIDLTNLYIAKHYCLAVRDNLNPDAEECLHQAMSFSKNPKEEAKVCLILAQYYENISEYDKMKSMLIQCQYLCNEKPDLSLELAHVLLLLGHYYFFQFSFVQSRKYLTKAYEEFESLLLKSRNKTQENAWINRLLSDCLHYIGRTYYEEYEFVNAAKYYIKAQDILEKNCKHNNLTEEQVATAFYHLRLGQILENCRLFESAMDHYEESHKIFTDFPISKSGLAQVNLALANMIKGDSTLPYQNLKKTFKKQEAQIKKCVKDARETGHRRGYLLALLQLLELYVKNFKINLALQTVWQVLTSDEFKRSGRSLFLLRFARKILLSFFYKVKLIQWRILRSKRLLYACPCSSHQSQQ